MSGSQPFSEQETNAEQVDFLLAFFKSVQLIQQQIKCTYDADRNIWSAVINCSTFPNIDVSLSYY